MNHSLPKPGLCLRVGIVGNRNFDWLDESNAESLDRLEGAVVGACEEVFSTLDVAISCINERSQKRGRFSGGRPRIKAISAFAKGGDQLGALAAIRPQETGERTCDFEIHGLMPFSETDFPGPKPDPSEKNPTFTERDHKRHGELVSEAKSVVRLDGLYAKAKRVEGVPGESQHEIDERERQYQATEAINRPRRYRAYRSQALMVLQHSDVLLAIWDRAAVGKAGGTEETVNEALRVGIPVIHVQPGTDSQSTQIRFLFRRKDAGRASFDEPWEIRLKEVVVRQLAFPCDIPEILSDLENGGEEAPATPDQEGASEACVNAEHENGSAYDPEAAFTEYFQPAGEFASQDRNLTAGAWKNFEGYFQRLIIALKEAGLIHSKKKSDDRVKNKPETEKPLVAPYEAYRSRAAELSRRYTGFYRGAFFLSYALAAGAVLLAILGFTSFHYYYHFECETLKHPAEAGSLERWQGIAFGCGIVFGVAKLFVLGWILRNQYVAKKECWQEKGGDFRFLAEMLRPMNFLAPLGMCTPNSRPAAHYADHDPRASWSNWLFRAIIRSQDMVLPQKNEKKDYTFSEKDVAEAKAKVLEHWLPGQIKYHRDNAAKHHDLFHGIENINKVALWVVIGAVFAHVVLELLAHYWKPSGHEFHPPHAIMVSLLILATLLPACIAISTGLLYQLDARRQSERSQIMASQLESNALKALSNLQDHPEGCNSLHVGGEIRDEIARIMIDEAADWQLLYRMDEVKAG